ncbi:MAG: LPS export ABC transporter permease LptG [Alphaproteobacteria bacterium]|nr:LPS export ABC transporter permease LptG [Alphaproteobacteria bacterium]
MNSQRFSLVLNTYIGRHFIGSFFTVLLTIMGLIVLFDMIELIRRAASHDNVRFTALLEMALFKLPHMIGIILPFGVMLGGMATFWILARSHELVVMRAAGVSAWQFMMPIAVIVLTLGVINVIAINPIAAAMYGRYEHFDEKLLLHHSSSLLLSDDGLWLRESQGDQQMVIHARDVRQNGFTLAMHRITILVFKDQDTFLQRFEAESGTLLNGFYELSEVWDMQPGTPAVHHDHFAIPTTLTVAKIQENFASSETISFWELPAYIQFFEAAGFTAHNHRLHLQSLLASPFLLCAMALLGASFSMHPNQRAGGFLHRLVGGIIAGFILYFFSKITYALGQSQTLPIWLAAWSPAAVTGLFGLSSVFHYEDG